MTGKALGGDRNQCEACRQPVIPFYVASEAGPILSCNCGMRPLISDDADFSRYSRFMGVAVAIILVLSLLLLPR